MDDILIGVGAGLVIAILISAVNHKPFDHKFLEVAKNGVYCIEREVSDLKLSKCYDIKEQK